MQNPYAATSTNLEASPTVEEYTPEMFQMSGRIGRVRYLAYCTGMYFIATFAIGLLFGIGRAVSELFSAVLVLIAMIPMVFGFYIVMRRRLHDLGLSGWYVLLSFIPFLNVLFSLYVLFAPGEKGSNDYGPKPSKNTTGLWIAGTILPAIFVIGIVAAIVLPAYSDYTKRARAAQAETSIGE